MFFLLFNNKHVFFEEFSFFSWKKEGNRQYRYKGPDGQCWEGRVHPDLCDVGHPSASSGQDPLLGQGLVQALIDGA